MCQMSREYVKCLFLCFKHKTIKMNQSVTLIRICENLAESVKFHSKIKRKRYLILFIIFDFGVKCFWQIGNIHPCTTL